MKETIRYEVQCRFCAHHIGGDSASQAADNIITHDIGHAFCGRCREVRVTVPEATLCDDCYHDTCPPELRPSDAYHVGVDLTF